MGYQKRNTFLEYFFKKLFVDNKILNGALSLFLVDKKIR